MSFKAKIAAAAATFALAGGGLGGVGTLSASAATPSCGYNCDDLYTQKFGPGFLLDTYQGRAAADQGVILFQASNSDPAEDFVIKRLGTVHGFYTRHGRLITAAFDRAYGRLQAFEFQYEPLGVNSGFCTSTWPGVVAQPGYKVRLEPCGLYSNSIWAAGATPRPGHGSGVAMSDGPSKPGYTYLINGATDSVSDPLVLNYPAGNPIDMPRPWLNVQPLHAYANGTLFDNQQWSALPGPVHGGM
jgi:hypothetical protein